MLAVFLFTGVANAQSSSLPDPGLLPGNPFYFLDILFEGLGSLVTFGDLSKAERNLALAEERLAELREEGIPIPEMDSGKPENAGAPETPGTLGRP